jgi:hypothetical protein
VVPSGDSVFVLVGPLLAKVHLELPHQGYASGSISPTTTAEAPVSMMFALLLVIAQVQLPTLMSTLSRIRDLPASPTVSAEASVSPMSLAVVYVPPMGVSAVLVKEIVPVKTASAKGLLQRGFLGLRIDSPSLPVVKEASSSIKGSLVDIVDFRVYLQS